VSSLSVLIPVYNERATIERLIAQVLAVDAGVPIRDVLVADASKRTTKSNAYVSGLGATRRVVLWDTLLQSTGAREVKLVIAHELGHRRERHAAKFTLLFIAAGAVGVIVLWAVLGALAPRDFPKALLLFTALSLLGMPVVAAVSRRWERIADRWSLTLTNDLAAYESTHIGLARENLSDLEPPRLAYLLLFTHPTTPERLAFGRSVAGAA
jgi:STE24 endopeptidase